MSSTKVESSDSLIREEIKFYEDFVKRLSDSVADDGRTPAKISTDAGIGANTLSGWIEGRRRIDISALVKIADELCISVDWLLGRKDDPRL